VFTGFLRAVGGRAEVGVACCEVGGPVLACVGDPADGRVDVDAEEVGEDGGGQVGGEGGEGSVAGGPGADAVAVELVGEAVEVQWLAGDTAREQPAGCLRPAGDHEAGRWLCGQLAEDRREAGREKDRSSARGQVGVAVFLGDLAGGEVAYPLELEGEQQDEGAGGADADRHRAVGEAALEELPSLVVAEEARGLLARDRGDGETAAEAAISGPAEEVADPVAHLGLLFAEPAVDVVLAELGQRGSLLVGPGQELKGDQDPDAQLAAYRRGERTPCGPAASPAQQGPVQERADEERVLWRLAGKVVIEPGRDAFKILITLGQDPGLDQDLPEVVQAVAGRQLVQKVVGDRPLLRGQVPEKFRGGALPDPVDRVKRQVDLGERPGEGPEFGRDGAVRSCEQFGDLVGEHAVGAAIVAVGVSRPPAPSAGEVDAGSRAGSAEPGAAGVPADQRMGLAAAGALCRGPDDGRVAAVADRPDRPERVDRLVAPAPGACQAGALVAGVAAVADRLAGGDPDAGADPPAA